MELNICVRNDQNNVMYASSNKKKRRIQTHANWHLSCMYR